MALALPTRFLSDTNVVSELARPAPSPSVVAWIAEQVELHVSAITVFELARGIEALSASRRRRYLERWLSEVLGRVRVHAVNAAESLAAASLEAHARRGGRAVDLRDLLIAATAKTAGLGVATRNVAHFTGLGVVVVDPFAWKG